MISDGSVGTFCSKITLPASSTTHTDVSLTDTSRPTKCAISSLLPRCSRSPGLDPFIVTEGDARSASKAEPQPPRYTIFGGHEYAFGRPRLNGSIAPVPDLQPSCRVSDMPRVLHPSPRSPLCPNRSRRRTMVEQAGGPAMPVIDVQLHPFD